MSFRHSPTCGCGGRMYVRYRDFPEGRLLFRECRACRRRGFFRWGIPGSWGGFNFSPVDITPERGEEMLRGVPS